jgi:hypothetical protein
MASDSDDDQDDNLATPTAVTNAPSTPIKQTAPPAQEGSDGEEGDGDGDGDDDDDDDEDADDDGPNDEPKLKYTRLTSSLGAVYRSGDSTSSFMVAGDKMVGHSLVWSSRSFILT